MASRSSNLQTTNTICYKITINSMLKLALGNVRPQQFIWSSKNLVSRFSRILNSFYLKFNMVVKDDDVNVMKLKASQAKEMLTSVQSQLDECLRQSVNDRISILEEENSSLREEIKQLKFILENTEGTKVEIPQNKDPKENLVEESTTKCSEPEKSKKKVEKKQKSKDTKPAKSGTSNEVIDVGWLDFRIGHILSVEKHPDADSLYVEKIDVGEPSPRTVVSGLVKHMPASDLENKTVVLLCNIKPVKMRGIASEAMLMCASTPEKVEVLIPPEGSTPGDVIECEGYERRSADGLIKMKIFETCAPDLKTDAACVATFKGTPFVVSGKGKIVSKTLANVQIK